MTYPYASFFRRLRAFLWDYLIIVVYILLITLISFAIYRLAAAKNATLPASPLFGDALAFTTLVLPVWLYFALFECSKRQATPGKLRAGLSVTGADGQRLSLGTSLLRSGLKLLPWQIAHTSIFHIPGWPVHVLTVPAFSITGLILTWVLVLASIVLVWLDRKHRSLYDLAAGSMVVDSFSRKYI